jgi:hypothetical protein
MVRFGYPFAFDEAKTYSFTWNVEGHGDGERDRFPLILPYMLPI